MRSLSILIVAVLVACVAATPTINTVIVGSSSSATDPLLAPPNRVVTVPFSNTAGFVVTIQGTNLLASPNAVLTVVPAPCDDCSCSNFAGSNDPVIVDRFNAYQARIIANAAALTNAATAAPFTPGTNTVRTATFPAARIADAEGAFGDFTKFNTRGLLCIIRDTTIAGVLGAANLINLNVFISVRFNCAGTNCEIGFQQTVSDRSTLIQRFASPAEIAQFRTQEGECLVGTSCSCFDDDSTIGCCGGKLFDRSSFKCCLATGVIAYLGDACPCSATSDCIGTDETACCLATKFPELGVVAQTTGQCYNAVVHRCCDTGERYNPGEDQCCVINGVQSVNVPCPCDQDLDCSGSQREGQDSDNNGNGGASVCCRQVNPLPLEVTSCSVYANFPSGTGPFAAQRCLGQCIDTSYQICCNGATCAKEFEKCCNQTCCNTFTGACHRVQRASAPGQRFNYLNFATDDNMESANLIVDVCTNIRQLNPIRAFFIFVLPTAFLLATFLALAVALVYANKAAIRVFTWVERFIIFFAVILALLACPLYFSPLYKYGGVIVLICFWAIITAATRVRWINAIAIGALIFLQIYLFDPFHGSAYFNLAYWRVWLDSPHGGMTDYRSNGILHTTRMMFPNTTTTNSYQWCTRYYDYFLEDPALKDYDRLDNPLRTTFGYCSRGWVMALYLLEGFIFIASLLLLVLVIMALINRFRKEVLEPVELEVRAVQDIAY